jgi:hypothetical protein
MGRAYKLGQMERVIKDNIKKVLEVAWVFTYHLMAKNTKDNGLMVRKTVKDCFIRTVEILKKEYGKTVRGLNG